MKYKTLFVGVIITIILCSSTFLVNAELFDPVIDGQKTAGEWSKANTYQVTFVDIDTSAEETGTVYVGRGLSAYHLALEINYPAGNAQGGTAFAISLAEFEPHEEQVLDRKIVAYFYNLTTQKWESEAYDQNEQQGTNISQNETAIDVEGAASTSSSKAFFEMSIPFTQTDTEPYDRHLSTRDEIVVVFTHARSYYNDTENLDWAFLGLSREYKLKINAESAELIIPTPEGISYHFGILASLTVVATSFIYRRRKI